jgi:hypothetical protein
MEITYIGWVAIPLGFILLLTRPDFLYKLMIFFIPFSATAIINVGSVGSGSGVPITMFFGSLYLFYKFTHICVTRNIKIPKIQTFSIKLIWIFGVVATLSSLIMPIIIDGHLLIASPTLSSNEVYPLTFSMTNFTQVLYLIYAIGLTTVVAKRNSQPVHFKATLRIYLLSAFFITAWGWLQVICYYTDIPYPDVIFNNSITMSAQGYGAEFGDLGIKRVSSAAVEPAVLAQYLMTVIPIVLFSVNHNEPILNSSKADKMILLATMSLLLITTSTTAYVGLVGMFIITNIASLVLGRLSLKWLFLNVVIIILISILYVKIPWMSKFIDAMFFTKSESYSGLERWNTIVNAWSYFLKYPILGIGLGSATSHDLVIKLLSNTGIVGLMSFGAIILHILYRLYNCMCINRHKLQKWGSWTGGTTVALLSYLFATMLTGFSIVFGHFWFVLGMAIAITSIIPQAIRQDGAEGE